MTTSPSFNDESKALRQTEPRVVVVHDYCTQRGGAERVTLDLLRAFPGARLVTSFWDSAKTYPDFADFDVETLWIDKLGPLRKDPRRAFPVLARTFSHHVIDDADVVICSSSGWAHRVSTSAPKIVYCHNPARWLYQPHDYLKDLPGALRSRFVSITHGLRRSDLAAARSATRYLVNSTIVGSRVRDAYGLQPTVVPPARGLSPEGPKSEVPGVKPGYLLTVSRARGYKNVEAICAAVSSIPGQRLVVVGGTPTRDWPSNATSVSGLDDAQMRWLYANARGMVAVAHEDFGLTPVEAQAFGVPSVLLREGGYLDSTVEGVTGVFVDDTVPTSIAAGIRHLLATDWNPDAIRSVGERYSKSTFTSRIRGIVDEVLSPNESSGLASTSSIAADLSWGPRPEGGETDVRADYGPAAEFARREGS